MFLSVKELCENCSKEKKKVPLYGVIKVLFNLNSTQTTSDYPDGEKLTAFPIWKKSHLIECWVRLTRSILGTNHLAYKSCTWSGLIKKKIKSKYRIFCSTLKFVHQLKIYWHRFVFNIDNLTVSAIFFSDNVYSEDSFFYLNQIFCRPL